MPPVPAACIEEDVGLGATGITGIGNLAAAGVAGGAELEGLEVAEVVETPAFLRRSCGSLSARACGGPAGRIEFGLPRTRCYDLLMLGPSL